MEHFFPGQGHISSTPDEPPKGALLLKAVSKPILAVKCHSERSEESRIYNKFRSFTSFRMTEKAGIEIAGNTFNKRYYIPGGRRGTKINLPKDTEALEIPSNYRRGF
jgi:hypothetical protein